MSLQSIRTKRFQSTHPAGGATHTARCRTGKQGISIHAPRGGCDRRRACRAPLRNDFNPRTPRGVRLGRCARPPVRIYFNPRTPRGVRLRLRARYRRSHRISIHAPRGGGRPVAVRAVRYQDNFNPRTPRGVRPVAFARFAISNLNFNPRTPRGVRQQNGPFLGPFCRYKTKKITYFPENEETLHSNRKKMLLFDTFSRANLPGDPCSLALRSLHKKRIRWQIGRFAPKMLHFVFISIPQIIEPQAVLLFVHNRYQFCLKNTALRRIERAFKDGVLHSLPVVYTLLCDLPEALAPFCILGVDVISDQYEHMASLPQKRRIPIEVAAQMSGKQHSLRIWNHSP